MLLIGLSVTNYFQLGFSRNPTNDKRGDQMKLEGWPFEPLVWGKVNPLGDGPGDGNPG